MLRVRPNFSQRTESLSANHFKQFEYLDITGMAPAYVNHPAVNETGLDGAWDFDLMWTGLGSLNGRANMGQTGDRTEAKAQLGSLTFFEAIEKQLGLKLTLQKRPMPVLIIDHLNPKPIEI